MTGPTVTALLVYVPMGLLYLLVTVTLRSLHQEHMQRHGYHSSSLQAALYSWLVLSVAVFGLILGLVLDANMPCNTGECAGHTIR